MPNKWKSKYQMEGLSNGEYYNVRDKQIYIIVNGAYVKKEANNEKK